MPSWRVSLTFDNGPTAGVTDAVLDVLVRRAAPAHFFVVGDRLRDPSNRSLVERAAAAGHRIGNHTMSHRAPLGTIADTALIDREIEEAQRLLGDLAGEEKLFRPNGSGGVIDERLLGRHALEHLISGQYTCVLWNVVPRDWLDPRGWVGTALDAIEGNEWSVVVLHDLPTTAMDHLDEFIAVLEQRDVELRPDLPDECVPLRRGRPTGSFGLLGLGEFSSDSACRDPTAVRRA